MAIAFDAGSWSSAGDLASGASHSHGGGGSARAACVLIADSGSATDRVTAVTYGGAAMAKVRTDTEATEAGATHVYWLDGVATGTQNVVVTHSGAIRIAVFTMTVTGGQVVALAGQSTGTSASASNPSWSMNTSPATTLCGLALHSGLQTMTNTPGSGWTLVVAGALGTGSAVDRGAIGAGFAYGAFGSSPVTCAWTAATADDYVGSSVAFAEAAPPPENPPPLLVMAPRRVTQ